VSVPRNAEIGRVIATYHPPLDGDWVNIVNCEGYQVATWVTLPTAAGYDDIKKTNIDGVGIRIYYNGTPSKSPSIIATVPDNNAWGYKVGPVKVELIKIGTIQGGSISTGKVGTVDAGGDSARMADIYVQNGGAISVAGCTPKKTVNVNLGQISAKTLSANTTAGTKLVDMGMSSCSGSFIGKAYLQATKPAGNSTDGLIASTGDASGVAVQILKDDASTPVKINQWVSYGTQNTWDLKYYARLYKTATIKAGSVKATANLYLSYE
jgi:type 1 fimbria pilin